MHVFELFDSKNILPMDADLLMKKWFQTSAEQNRISKKNGLEALFPMPGYAGPGTGFIRFRYCL